MSRNVLAECFVALSRVAEVSARVGRLIAESEAHASLG